MLSRVRSLLVFLLFALCFFALQSSVSAQTVGTHLGEGDVGTQKNSIDILQSNGAGSGFPVTALMNVNMAAENQSDMIELFDKIKAAGFYPIIRITYVCDSSLTQSRVQAAINNINAQFPGGNVTIVYGNEVNNKAAECGSWERYITEYNWVKNMPNVIPAALDYYNGDYKAEDFLKTPGASEIYGGGGLFAANGYGCTFIKEPECDPSTTDTHNIGIAGYSNYILTEFSLSPEGRVADAPDTNLEKVIQFIQERAGGTSAAYITPLVRNVCNNEGEWLLYLNGRLFTRIGTEVTNDCEGNVEGGIGYNLDPYPEYGIDQHLYYVHPIQGAHPKSIYGRNVEAARTDLAMQGYEAYCASEPSYISLDYDTRETIQMFMDMYADGKSQMLYSTYMADSSMSDVSIFRDTNDKRFLTTSIEEFYSFKDVYVDEPTRREITSAPINSLLSMEQKCTEAVRLLRDTQLMCERLADPGSCPQLARPIPGTDYTVQTLLEDTKKFIPDYRAGGIRSGCIDLYSTGSPEYNEYKLGLQNTPLNIDRSYRLAFLVVSIEQRPPEEKFNFYNLLTSADPYHEVLTIAFKIPDILTNKGNAMANESGDTYVGSEAGGHQYFTDAASHTRNVLVPRVFKTDKNNGFDAKSNERRNSILKSAESNKLQDETSTIYCLKGEGNTQEELEALEGSPACKDVLGKAVVDIINGQSPSCSHLKSEEVNAILERASIIPPGVLHPTRVFDPGYGFGTDILNWLFIGSTNTDPQRAINNENPFQTYLTVKKGLFNFPVEEAKVDYFLVYPVGYELDSVTNIIKNTFLAEAQVENLSQDDDVSRFDTKGFIAKLNGDGWTEEFTLLPKTPPGCSETGGVIDSIDLPIGVSIPVFPAITVPVCEKEDFTITIKETGGFGLKILGAHLGYWTRNIQRQFNTYYGYAYAYIRSCKTTEEFLTGTCMGGQVNKIVDGSNPNEPGQPGTSGPSYCLDWNKLPDSKYEQIKDAVRSYLTSFTYSYNQWPGFTQPLKDQFFIDWTGELIPSDSSGYQMINFWENYYGGGRALLWTMHPDCGGQACFDYIMDKCQEAGVNPAFCIGISFTEDGGLNTVRFPGNDLFGCAGAIPNDINSGLNCIINNFFLSTTPRDGKLVYDMDFNEMWMQFDPSDPFASSSYSRLESFLQDVTEYGDVGYSPQVCPT